MRSLVRLVLPALLACAAAACSTDCSSRVDAGIGQGIVRDAGDVALANVAALVEEDPDNQPYWKLSIYAFAPAGSTTSPLNGHVTGAHLVSASGEVLLDLPVPAGTSASLNFVNLQLALPSQSSYLHIRDAVVSGQARILIETDLPGRERLAALLPDVQYNPPSHRSCSFT